MEHALGFLLAGAAFGFASSAPIGPINLWVADATLDDRDVSLGWFLAGVVGVDVAFAALAAWGYVAYLQDGTAARIVGSVGGLFLVLLGVLSLLRGKTMAEAGPKPRPASALKQVLMGAALTGSNPAFLMFWAFAIDLLVRQFGWGLMGLSLASFLCGIVSGDLLWFSFLIALVKRGKAALSRSSISWLRTALATGLIVLGVVAAYRSLWPST